MRIQKLSTNANRSFKGTPVRAPKIAIKDYTDALKAWEFLKSAKYLDVHSDKTSSYNKIIRQENYSFLDKLTSSFDKMMFIANFCDYTKFPFLYSSSTNMHDSFMSTIHNISEKLNRSRYNSEYEILDAGYDPTCSLGLKKAFPGSDLDKGYVILKGSDYSDYTNIDCVNNFKSELWNNLDQRLVSLNHPDNEVSVYTKKQVEDILSKLNSACSRKEKDEEKYSRFNRATIATALVIAGQVFIKGLMSNKDYRQAHATDPYIAGKFNRDLTKYINGASAREEAKNFAFFIETVKANLYNNRFTRSDYLFDEISNSKFVQNSNVTQIPAWRQKISEGYLKSKLRNSESLQRDFEQMSLDTKYELVKDIVKYSSDDHSNRFSIYFKNDDDISLRYEKLLNALK